MKPKNLCLAAAVMALSMVTGLLTSSGTAHAQLPTVPHYKCYEITGTAPAVSPVNLKTQFGLDARVVVGAPTRLCLAATKNGAGSLTVPDVECYQITGQPAGHSVNLLTQFGTTTNVVVGLPNELCVPVARAIPPAVPTAPQAAPHYECFNIPGTAPGVSVLLETQFGQEPGMLVGAPTRLCLPAVKNGEGTLSDSEPHVECFGITGPAAAPIPNLNLVTQFDVAPPLQENVVVGIPKELCVPALKEVLVGGIAEAPDADTSTLGATASGGSSGTTYAVIAGIVAGALMLGAGGWYARRRWLS